MAAKPRYHKGSGPDSLPQGAAQALNAASAQAGEGAPSSQPARPVASSPPPPQPPPPVHNPDELAGLPPEVQPAEPGDNDPQDTGGDATGFDAVLFHPTDRPDEPVTAGAAFGEGFDFGKNSGESDRAFMDRVAMSLAEAPGATSRVKMLALRIARGE